MRPPAASIEANADQVPVKVAALPAFENLAEDLRATVRRGRDQLVRDPPKPG